MTVGSPDSAVPVLAYHDITDAAPDDPFAVSPAQFEEQLDALVSEGFKAPTLSSIAVPKAPSRRVYLTFDDAFTSFSDIAVPLLAERGLSATVFVPTAWVGLDAAWAGSTYRSVPRVMSWDELRDLDGAMIELGAHGHRHLESDILSKAVLADEFTQSRMLLEQHTGRSVTSLAYPFGYHSRRVRRAASAAGFVVACGVGGDLHPSEGADLLWVRRQYVTAGTSGDGLLDQILRSQRSGPRSILYGSLRPGWRAVRLLRHHLLGSSRGCGPDPS